MPISLNLPSRFRKIHEAHADSMKEENAQRRWTGWKWGCLQDDQAKILTERVVELAKILAVLRKIEVAIQSYSLLDSAQLSGKWQFRKTLSPSMCVYLPRRNYSLHSFEELPPSVPYRLRRRDHTQQMPIMPRLFKKRSPPRN